MAPYNPFLLGLRLISVRFIKIGSLLRPHRPVSSFDNAHLGLLLNSLSFFDHLSLVDLASLVLDARSLLVNVDVHYVVLMELFGPSLWDPILNFVFELVHVRVL